MENPNDKLVLRLRNTPPWVGDRTTADQDLIALALKAARNRGEQIIEKCSACAERAVMMFGKCGFCLTSSFR